MSHYMTALAMQQSGIKPAAKIVLYWLSDHHNGETGACFPSLNTLAAECEMDRSTVVRHLEALESAGLIARDKRVRANGSQTSTAYILKLQPVAKRNSPCGETQQPPVAKCDPHNLGTINLGSEPESSCELFPISKPIPVDDTAMAFSAYNSIAERVGWPVVQKVTPARRSAVKARIKDCGGYGAWNEAMQRAEKSPFLSGKKTGTTPASFDWLNAPKNFTKLMEGNYDERNNAEQSASGASNTRAGGAHQNLMAGFAEVANRDR